MRVISVQFHAGSSFIEVTFEYADGRRRVMTWSGEDLAKFNNQLREIVEMWTRSTVEEWK